MSNADNHVIAEISANLRRYCQETLFALVTQKPGLVAVRRSRSKEFNARVETNDSGATFTVFLNDGVVSQIRQAISLLASDTPETIDHVLRDTALALTGNAEREPIFRQMIHGSLLFVLLHEVSHITCGHFQRVIAAGRSPARNVCEFQFDEVTEPPADTASSGCDALNSNLVRLSELEADAIAFDLMDVLALELIEANSELRELIDPDDSAETPEQRRINASELMFYSACAGMAMIEATRGVSHDYPYPFSRLFNIADVYVQRRFQAAMPDVADETGVLEIPLNDQRRTILQEIAIPTMFNAMEICEACCESAGCILADRFGWKDDPDSIAMKLTTDFLELLTNVESPEFFTREARQVHEMRLLRQPFAAMMSPFRMQLSYR